MTAATDQPARDSIGELFGRATSEGKAFANAQVELVKQTALDKVDKAKGGVGLVVGAGLFAYAGLIVLLVAILLWLVDIVGPIGAGLIVSGVVFAISFIMIKIGLGKLSAMSASSNGRSN